MSKKIRLIFSISIIFAYMFSIKVFASDTLIEEKIIKTVDKDNVDIMGLFDDEIIKGNITYKLSSIIDYNVIDEINILKEEKQEEKIKLEPVPYKDIKLIEKEIKDEIYKGDTKLVFDKVDFEKTELTNRKIFASGELETEFLCETPDVKNTENEFKATDPFLDKETTVKLPFKSLNTLEPFKWQSDVEIGSIFHNIESQFYHINNEVLIPYQIDKPVFEGYEDEILKALNLPLESYKITNSEWIDSSEDNIKKAVYYGERYVAKFLATYAGEYELEPCVAYVPVLHYTGAVSTIVGKEYMILAQVMYEPIKTSNTPLIVAGGSSAIVIVVGAYFMLSFNNAVVYYNNKRIFSTKIKKKGDKFVISLDKLKRYSLIKLDEKEEKIYNLTKGIKVKIPIKKNRVSFLYDGKEVQYKKIERFFHLIF